MFNLTAEKADEPSRQLFRYHGRPRSFLGSGVAQFTVLDYRPKHPEKYRGSGKDNGYPGPIQFFGPTEITDQILQTLALEFQGT